MPEPSTDTRRTLFATELGWMALVRTGDVLQRLVFGYPTANKAEKALGTDWLAQSRLAAWNDSLQRRLQDYAAGQCVEFDDVPVEMDGLTNFGRRVFLALRKVRYGQTTTYGALAAEAGSPKAARAVGNLMAANPIPLVLPCHRVVCFGKQIGNYSAPGGAAMKRHLLEVEKER